jgi:hypothetical protein
MGFKLLQRAVTLGARIRAASRRLCAPAVDRASSVFRLSGRLVATNACRARLAKISPNQKVGSPRSPSTSNAWPSSWIVTRSKNG